MKEFQPNNAYDEDARRLTARLRAAYPDVWWKVHESLDLYIAGRTDHLVRDWYLIRGERNKIFVEFPVTGQMVRDAQFDVIPVIGKRMLWMLDEGASRQSAT